MRYFKPCDIPTYLEKAANQLHLWSATWLSNMPECAQEFEAVCRLTDKQK